MSARCAARLCRGCAGDDGPLLAASGSTLCRGCARRVDQLLEDVPGLYADLAMMLRRSAHAMTGRISGTGEEPTFINGAAADARADLYAKTCSWARVVVEDRALTWVPFTIAEVAAFLRRNGEWIAAQQWCADFCAEINAVSRAARRAAYPSGERRIVLRAPDGKLVGCAERFESSDVATRRLVVRRCNGMLTAVVRQTDALLPSEITCHDCASVTPIAKWITLGRHWHAERVSA